MSEPTHTTRSAAEYLQRRFGITVQSRTVKQWCNRGKLPGAYRIGEGRRAVWQIPQNDLDSLIFAHKIAHSADDAPGGDEGIPH